jgi:hypothetical protein
MNIHNRHHLTANRQWIIWEPSWRQGRLSQPVFQVCSSSRKTASCAIILSPEPESLRPIRHANCISCYEILLGGSSWWVERVGFGVDVGAKGNERQPEYCMMAHIDSTVSNTRGRTAYYIICCFRSISHSGVESFYTVGTPGGTSCLVFEVPKCRWEVNVIKSILQMYIVMVWTLFIWLKMGSKLWALVKK